MGLETHFEQDRGRAMERTGKEETSVVFPAQRSVVWFQGKIGQGFRSFPTMITLVSASRACAWSSKACARPLIRAIVSLMTTGSPFRGVAPSCSFRSCLLSGEESLSYSE